MTTLISQLSETFISRLKEMRTVLGDFLERSAGKSEHETKVKESLNKIENLLNLRKAVQIEDSLKDLEDAAKQLKKVTAKIQNAIDNIKQTDKSLEKTAGVVEAIGVLASAIGSGRSSDIGNAIEELLKSSGS